MKTTKPISTISFNTPSFLNLKLHELTRAGVISFWAFVCHLPEDDEGGKKEHIHLYIEPSKLLQTDDIKAELLEPDPENVKPRGCLPFQFSKFPDWYMYGIHDAAYLASKGESRTFEYRYDDVISSDSDNLLFLVRSIDLTKLTPFQAIRQAQGLGLSFGEFFSMGRVPLPQISLYEKAWTLLMRTDVYRNSRPNHPMDVNDGWIDSNKPVPFE